MKTSTNTSKSVSRSRLVRSSNHKAEKVITPIGGDAKPEYVRLPKPGERCPWTGLSRGTLNDLILGPEAPVDSVVIAKKEAKRGVRLIHFVSLMTYLDGLMDREDSPNGKDLAHD